MDNDLEGGQRAATPLLGMGDPPTETFSSSDTLALGPRKAPADRRMGMREELSLVGFDDIPIAESVTQSLTTVRQPIAEMATVVIGGLQAMVGDPRFRPELVRRLRLALVMPDSRARAAR